MCWPIGTLEADVELTRGSTSGIRGIHQLLLQSEIEPCAPVTPNICAFVYLAVLSWGFPKKGVASNQPF